MRCPTCGGPCSVIDTRERGLGNVYRRRSCTLGHRFSTTETPGGEHLALAKKEVLTEVVREVRRRLTDIEADGLNTP